ncbi:MAG: TonB-dependent receptor domain-containing protein [Gemmatimonadota bacterium]
MKGTLVVYVGLLLAGAGSLDAQVRDPAAGRPAQPGTGEIRGRVVSAEDGQPVPGASVAVWSPVSSSIVAGAVVSQDGTFRVQGLQPGTYHVRVISIGYTSHRSADLALDNGSPILELGTIRLATDLVEANEIDVAVERPTITLEPDRNTYLAKDVAPAATTASEVLQAVPSVQVDPEGKVSLRGNENVAVHINGRPAPVQGDQLAAYLQQLPANVIDRVEVIPTPSAKYDPEGMAGIINITMAQNTDLGTSGGFTLGLATAERYNLGANLGYQRGPLTLFTTYGSHWTERDIVGINDRERRENGVPVSFTQQDLAGASGWEGHNVSTTLEYRLGERDVVSQGVVLNRRQSTDDQVSVYTVLDGSESVTDRFDRPRDEENDALVLDYTLGFKRTYEPREHELSTELRFNRSDDDDRNDLWRQPPSAPGPRTEVEINDVDALSRELIGQLDYSRALGERTRLETGYKGSARWIERAYTVLEDPLGTGEFVRSDLSNAFDFDENVQAVYGVLSRSVGKFELQAGLRAEYASQDFILSDANFPKDYASLFPSGLAVYNASEATQLKLSYSRRIKRPNTHELNPFPVFFDEQNVFFGNPELDPEYTDAFELGYSRSGELGSFQLTPFYRHTTDIIRFIVDTDAVVDGREVTSITFENLANSDSWGADVNGSLDLGERFSGLASFNVFKMVTDGGSETSLSSNAVTWSARVNGTTELTPSLSLQAMYFYRAPMNFERGRFSSWKMASITLKQKLWEDRASLSLRFVDPFDTMGFRVEAGDDNVLQVTERDFDARAVHLTFQYNFGTAPKVRQPRPDVPQEPTGGFP